MSKNHTILTHHEDQVYYSIARAEFDQLKEKARTPEKENCLFLLGLFIPSLINFLSTKPDDTKPVPLITIVNIILMIVTFIFFVFQSIRWYSKKSKYDDFINELESRPKVEMQISGDAEEYVKTTGNDAYPEKGDGGN